MNEFTELAITLADDNPEIAAAVLSELPPATIVTFLTEVSATPAPTLVSALPSPVAISCLGLVTAEQAASWLQAVGYPLRTVLARGLSAPFRTQVLSVLPKSSAMQITRDIAYVPDSVGAWMEEATGILSDEENVGEALARIRRQKHVSEQSLVVVGKSRKYLGIVTLATLVRASDKKSIGSLADRSIAALDPDTPLAEAAEREEWGAHFLLPVTGKRNSFLGILRRERLDSAMQQDVATTELPGSDLLSHLMEAALISAAGMSRLFPVIQDKNGDEMDRGD